MRRMTQTGAEPAAAPLHAIDPSPREIRAQMVMRLQVGLFGLALMLLLVALANVIMQHARSSAPQGGPMVAASGAASGNTDPLADMGVVPAPDGANGEHRSSQRGATQGR